MKFLAIEGNPLLIRTSLTIEGNASRITTHNSWKPLTIEGSPLLIRQLFRTFLTIEQKPYPYYRNKSFTI